MNWGKKFDESVIILFRRIMFCIIFKEMPVEIYNEINLILRTNESYVGI